MQKVIIMHFDGLILCIRACIRWRTMFGIAVIPSVLLALGMAFSPESPRWLYQVSLST